MFTSVPTLNSLLAGITVLQRTLARLGYSPEGFRLLIPTKLGMQLEDELQRHDPEDWGAYCDGIEVHADGKLKQILLFETMYVGWKTERRRARKARGLTYDKSHGKTDLSGGDACCDA